MLYPLKFPYLQFIKINSIKIYPTSVLRNLLEMISTYRNQFQTNALPTKLGQFVEQHNKQLMLYQLKFSYFKHTKINSIKIYPTSVSRNDTLTENDQHLSDKFQTNFLSTKLVRLVKRVPLILLSRRVHCLVLYQQKKKI